MRNKLLVSLVAMVFGVALVGAACSSDNKDAEAKKDEATTTTAAEESTTTTTAKEQTIVDIAASNPDFSTLVSLVKSAGLAETLSGAGPFTVFAPTNAAFAKVPAATLQQLQADPQGALANVLKLHVVSGKVMAADAGSLVGQCVDTLGGKVKITKDGDTLAFGGAPIVKTDIEGSNGVIHVIDGVVTAPSTDC
jgi:uncharacterized surface protein with fasciclin (FAS1) repeats